MPGSITRETYFPGAQIFREGEPGTCAYIIEKGGVSLSLIRGGKPVVIGTLGEGDLFGEMALIDDHLRSATVTANEETELIRVPRDYVKDKLDHSDQLMQLFLKVVLERFRTTHDNLLRLKTGGTYVDADEAVDENSPEAVRQAVIDKLRFEHELQEAFEQDQFELYFQPIVELNDDTLAGFEALIRWNHPTRGLVSPGQFLGLAEETGLIVPLGRTILANACDALAAFQECAEARISSSRRLFMTANVSPVQIAEPDFADTVCQAISGCNVAPENIRLEITENALLGDPRHAEMALGEITRAGLRLAIDDFGTGFSSLSYLRRFPIDTLKIDHSFVTTMLDSPRSMEIVRALAGLATSLGMDIIAEGIETEAQRGEIRGLGCGYGQGFFLSHPLRRSEALELVRTVEALPA